MDYDGAMKPLKGKEGNNWNSFPNSQTAFLGPQLWEKKISMSNVDQDFKNWQGYRYVVQWFSQFLYLDKSPVLISEEVHLFEMENAEI